MPGDCGNGNIFVLVHQRKDLVLPSIYPVGFTTDITTDMFCSMLVSSILFGIGISRVQYHFECRNIVQDEFGRTISIFLKSFLYHTDTSTELIDITERLHGLGLG